MSDHDGRTTTDRRGRPARVSGTGEEGGIPGIDFQEPDEGLEEIDRETTFAVFEDRRLAFLHQEETGDGGTSRFNSFL